jgi:GNAT superfamily N-acetyltransferase
MDTNATHLCQPSAGQEDDWRLLYENSFPQDERMLVTEIRQHLQQGTMLLHKTVNKNNDLLCFSLTFPLHNPDCLLLSYIATDPTKRSGGFGSKHMKRLVEILKAQYPNNLGLFLEIESTREPGLDQATHKARQRRLEFYQRLGAKRLCKKYLMPSMVAGAPPRHGELMWLEFGTHLIDDPTLMRVILAIYEKAYSMKPSDPLYQGVIAQFAGAVSGGPATTCATTSPCSACGGTGTVSGAPASNSGAAGSGGAGGMPGGDGSSKGSQEGGAVKPAAEAPADPKPASGTLPDSKPDANFPPAAGPAPTAQRATRSSDRAHNGRKGTGK